jgi:hypothetical protein
LDRLRIIKVMEISIHVTSGGGTTKILLSGWGAGEPITIIIRTIDAITWLRRIWYLDWFWLGVVSVVDDAIHTVGGGVVVATRHPER